MFEKLMKNFREYGYEIYKESNDKYGVYQNDRRIYLADNKDELNNLLSLLEE